MSTDFSSTRELCASAAWSPLTTVPRATRQSIGLSGEAPCGVPTPLSGDSPDGVPAPERSGVRVSAIIVNFNQREHLRHCLTSVFHALAQVDGATEVLLVDNASSDGSAEMVAREFPQVRLQRAQRNVGFATAICQALTNASGTWIFMLNNDATIATDAVRRMLDVGEREATVGSIAALVLFADGGGRINSAGIDVDRVGVAFDRLLGKPAAAAAGDPSEVFGASAAGALLRRRMLEDIGGFDPRFFLYLEDVDVAWRARTRDWRCVLVPDALVYHHHSVSSGHGSAFKYEHVGRNRIRLLAKNAPTAHLLRYGPLILAYDAAYVLFVAARERSLAPLRGRWAGLREWRLYRGDASMRGAEHLSPPRGLRAALSRRSAWRTSSAGVRRC